MIKPHWNLLLKQTFLFAYIKISSLCLTVKLVRSLFGSIKQVWKYEQKKITLSNC